MKSSVIGGKYVGGVSFGPSADGAVGNFEHFCHYFLMGRSLVVGVFMDSGNLKGWIMLR